MIEIFKTIEGEQNIIKVNKVEKGCWINMVSPTEEELTRIQNELDIVPNFLRDPLDEEERPRIDVEDNQLLVIIDIPYVNEYKGKVKFETLPMGLIITDDYFITVCLRENPVSTNFKEKRIKEFYTFKKTRFTFQILFFIAKDFLKYLRNIDKKTYEAEETLHKSMKNNELFNLLDLEKSLVFFTTSLKSNEIVMEKLLRGKYLKMYEEDQELLEDVIIENKQAIEMANIYSSILNGTMDAFASVISNNLNGVMKILTSVTIVMAIPTMIYSFFGMNVKFHFLSNDPFGLLYILGFSLVASAGAVYVMLKKRMF